MTYKKGSKFKYISGSVWETIDDCRHGDSVRAKLLYSPFGTKEYIGVIHPSEDFEFLPSKSEEFKSLWNRLC